MMDERAKRGSGHIYQRGSVWWIAYYAAREDGRNAQVRESAKTTDERKARDLLAKRLRQVANDREGIADFENPEARRVTCAEVLDELFADFTTRAIRGLGDVEYKMRKGSPLRTWFGQIRVANLKAKMLDKYVASRRAAGKANATINRELELLKQAVMLAFHNGRVVKVPKRFPGKLPEDNARQGFFEKAELDRLLPHLPDPLADLTRFAFVTGWRRGELLGLRWESVTRDEIRLGTTKNGEPRSLPLSPVLSDIVERRRKARNFSQAGSTGLSAFVFHRRGRAIGANVFGNQWRAACVKAGLGCRIKDESGVDTYVGKLFHDLRRTAARNMVRAGVPETVAMKITGHKTRAMFDRYDIANDRDKLAALEASQRFSEANRGEENVAAIADSGQG